MVTLLLGQRGERRPVTQEVPERSSGCWWLGGCHRCWEWRVLQGCEWAAPNTRLHMGFIWLW